MDPVKPGRVLITTPNLELPGGVANFYRVLRRHLDSSRSYFQVGPSPGEAGGLQAVRRLLTDSLKFHRELGPGRYQLVHLNPSLVPRALLRDGLLVLIANWHRCPVVVFFHGWDPSVQAVIQSRYRWLFRFVFNRAAGLVVLASEFREALAELGIRRPVFLETTLVDDAVWSDGGLFRDPTTPVTGKLLYLSRLEQGKGLVETIEAFDIIRTRFRGASLTVVGNGPEGQVGQELVAKRGITGVVFRGHIEGAEKAEAFKSAEVYVFPTYYSEGMPTTVLEAMAYGLPIVTRPVGGLKDFFEDRKMGFWTESREPRDIAALIDQALSDPIRRLEMSDYNRNYAREHFAASSLARRLEQLYFRFARTEKA